MSEIKEQNAIISGTMLGFEDHGILTAYIYLDYGWGGQGFGGYNLSGDAMSAFVKEILEVLEIDEWEKLKGVHIRVRAEQHRAHAIGHYVKDKWFYPKEFFEKMYRKTKPVV